MSKETMAFLPHVLTFVVLLIGSYLSYRAKQKEVDSSKGSAITVAEIEAGTASENQLWEYLKDANARHELDITKHELTMEKLFEIREKLTHIIIEKQAIEAKLQSSENIVVELRRQSKTQHKGAAVAGAWPPFWLWQRIGIAAYRCDKSGYCIEANPALCELFGMSEQEMLRDGWAAAIPDATARINAWANWIHLNNAHLPYSDTYSITNHETGNNISVTTWAGALLGNDGDIESYIGIVVET